MPADSPLDAIRDELSMLGRAVRAMAETQNTHTKMLGALLDAAADPPDGDDALARLLERILMAVEAQTAAFNDVRRAVLGSERPSDPTAHSRG